MFYRRIDQENTTFESWEIKKRLFRTVKPWNPIIAYLTIISEKKNDQEYRDVLLTLNDVEL